MSAAQPPGPRLKKALGQHFLTRPESCAPLIRFLRPAGSRVLEIGPGAGTLTRALLDAGATVTAWELDPGWAVAVRHRFAGEPLAMAIGDATQIAWGRLPAGMLVAGNLPYNVATVIVSACLESTIGRDLPRAAFLVQREVGERLAAGPGDGAYGALSVLVGALARVELLGQVPRGAFRPPPKVDSVFVGLTPRTTLEPDEYRRLVPLVRAAFGLRRKTLRNALASRYGIAVADELLRRLGMDPSTRAGSLALDSFRELAAHLQRVIPAL